MIQDRHGHSIYLDWPEKEGRRVAGTESGRIAPWERIGSLKLRDFDEARLAALSARVINLRASYGPRELQRRYVLPAAARLRAHPRIAAAIRETLARFGGRPAVAVHLPQGGFHPSRHVYDANAHPPPAPAISEDHHLP